MSRSSSQSLSFVPVLFEVSMPVIYRKEPRRWMYPFLCSLLFSMAVTACSTNGVRNENAETDNTLSKASTQTDKGTASPSNENTNTDKTLSDESTPIDRVKLNTGEEGWVTLHPGEEKDGLKFTKDGALSYQGKVLLPNIPVSYVSDGTVKYAGRLIVSNPSPSGNFNFFQACEQPSDGGSLCWALFVVDKEKGKATKTHAGKYGPLQWVKWSRDERYAILANQNEGASWLHAIDLQTGDSKPFKDEGWSCSNIDLNSFSWIDDKGFKVKIYHTPGCPGNTDKSFLYTGNIEDIF